MVAPGEPGPTTMKDASRPLLTLWKSGLREAELNRLRWWRRGDEDDDG